MNIVLIGMRGAGKSSVSKIVARKLGREFVEMDDLIAKAAGKSISALVKDDGWEKFRALEAQVCREVANMDNKVISTGGGVVENQNNVKNLKVNGQLFLLLAKGDTLTFRIGGDKHRPLLTNAASFDEDLKKVWAKRKSMYHNASDFQVETDDLSAEEVADKVIEILKEVAGAN